MKPALHLLPLLAALAAAPGPAGVAAPFPPPPGPAGGTTPPAPATGAIEAVPPPAAPTTSPVVIRRCLMEYDQVTQFTAPLPSFLQTRLVKLGDRVKSGQLMGNLFDQALRAQLEQMTIEAESDVLIRAAKSDLARAEIKLTKTERLGKRDFVSAEQLLEDKFVVERAQLAVVEAEQKRQVSQALRRRAEAELRAQALIAPHDGIVVDIMKNQGESVGISEPILKLVNTEKLRVWGQANVTDLWRVKVGQKVRVMPEVAGADLDIEREIFNGEIAFIDSFIVPATQTCKVMALIRDDKGALKSGLTATMVIFPEEGTKKASPDANKPATPARVSNPPVETGKLGARVAAPALSPK